MAGNVIYNSLKISTIPKSKTSSEIESKFTFFDFVDSEVEIP